LATQVGSESVNGAGSNILEHILKRVFLSFCSSEPRDLFEVAARRSFLVSADMAHACHPNYSYVFNVARIQCITWWLIGPRCTTRSDKHEDRHAPAMHAGVVIKNNANQRYATTSVSGFFIRELARRNDIPVQEFVVRNDSLCGSTIGPMLSARGFRTVDIGAPQLSMHRYVGVSVSVCVSVSVSVSVALSVYTHTELVAQCS
jgi:aspartyl aminopeptidase